MHCSDWLKMRNKWLVLIKPEKPDLVKITLQNMLALSKASVT